jgi:phosphoglycolate phosphatase
MDVTSLDAAIVDLDGTMIDTIGDFELALSRALADLELPPVSRDFIERTVGKGSHHLLQSVLTHLGQPVARIDSLWPRYQHHYLAVNGQASAVYPGVVEGLQSLRAAGLRLACLTNKPGNFARPLLAAKGLAGYFEHVFGGDAFARQKPDPLPLIETCRALGTAPARTLMIGDSANDAQAARAAGCPVVLVRYGYNHGEPVDDIGADGLVDSLEQIASGRRYA